MATPEDASQLGHALCAECGATLRTQLVQAHVRLCVHLSILAHKLLFWPRGLHCGGEWSVAANVFFRVRGYCAGRSTVATEHVLLSQSSSDTCMLRSRRRPWRCEFAVSRRTWRTHWSLCRFRASRDCRARPTRDDFSFPLSRVPVSVECVVRSARENWPRRAWPQT